MKRLTVRLLALSTLVVLGLFAIAQAQRMSRAGEDTSGDGAKTTRFAAANDDQPAADGRFIAADSSSDAPSDRPAMPRRVGRAADTEVQVVSGEDSGTHATRTGYDDNHQVVAASDERSDQGTAARDAATRDDQSSRGIPFGRGNALDRTSDHRDAADNGEVVATAGDEVPASDAAVRKDAARESGDDVRMPRRFAADDAASEIPAHRSAADAAQNDNSREAPINKLRRDTADNNHAATDRAANDRGDADRSADRSVDRSSTQSEGTATPGSRELEGPQTPSLTIEKVAPPEMQIGKTATVEIRVQNSGRVTARNLQITDLVPQGTRLVSTDPRCDLGSQGELLWNVPTLAPGATTTVKVELMPLAEGAVGSVATVGFRADASARTTITRPKLAMQVQVPETIMVGQPVTMAITVSNPGTGAASGVILEADIPANLKHVAGTELEFEIGVLKPNETRRLELSMTAVKAGSAKPNLAVHAEGVAPVQETPTFEIVAPKLEVALEGPKRRFLDRKATHVVVVSNPGTAPAKDVELVAYLPKGMKFVEANNHGSYDARQHAVYWSLEELPAHKTGDVQLVTLPTESGDQTIRVQGKAQQGLADEKQETIAVEGVSALSFQISDLADPLEIGGQATYEVRVTNSGSKSATNVQVSALLPAEMTPIDATGPTTSKLQNGKIMFEPIARLAPKEEKTFRIRAEATKAGDLRVRVQLTSDDLQQAVTQEESTRVFGDEK
jgi:uncharacterized repeat protein (TIGR01451 family)